MAYKTLASELIAHIRQIGNNPKYHIETRTKALEQAKAEINTLLDMLWYEKSEAEIEDQ